VFWRAKARENESGKKHRGCLGGGPRVFMGGLKRRSTGRDGYRASWLCSLAWPLRLRVGKTTLSFV
jgi:hypothetical protein